MVIWRRFRKCSPDKSFGGPEGTLTWMRWYSAMLARDFPAAQDAIDQFPFDTLPSVFSGPVPKSYLEGCIALAQGNNREAQQFFESARPVMEAEALADPDNELRHARAGVLRPPTWTARMMRSARGNGPQSSRPSPTTLTLVCRNSAKLALIYARVANRIKPFH